MIFRRHLEPLQDPDDQASDLFAGGSGVLIQSLMRGNLVDRNVLMIHPVVLGSGRRMFVDKGAFTERRLVDTKTSTTGVVIATYEPAIP